MRTKILRLVLACLFLIILISAQEKTSDKELTPLQIYVRKAMKTPLTFIVQKEKVEETWGKIQSFIAKYSSMKIQITSDYVIETYNPTKVEIDDPKWPGLNYGYSAIKTPKGDKVEITVKCIVGEEGDFYKFCANHNAHLLAYYALTGELKEESVRVK